MAVKAGSLPENPSEIRDAAMKHLWMHNRGWEELGEDEPIVAISGKGIRINDSEGRSWIDVNGGYM